MHKKVRKLYGQGINDADYAVATIINGTKTICPYYKVWAEMIRRCYSEVEHKKHPTYVDCRASDEWLIFSQFKKWMQSQDWRGKELDKDILFPGNKLYSPATSRFISKQLNGVLIHCSTRINLPKGVTFHKETGKFRAKIHRLGRHISLGLFHCPSDAHAAWANKKKDILREMMCEQSDVAVINGILLHIKKLDDSIAEISREYDSKAA